MVICNIGEILWSNFSGGTTCYIVDGIRFNLRKNIYFAGMITKLENPKKIIPQEHHG